MERIISLGWDVAGYSHNSKRNAFAIATKEGMDIKLQECSEQLTCKNGYYNLPLDLFANCDRVIIAIDAPFGFPSSLWKFINEEKDLGTYFEKDSKNIYVFRETDLKIIRLCGKNPLSPVFDKLGRNTLRAIRQLRKWKAERKELSVLPWDDENNANLTAIEVYPGLLAGKIRYFYNQFSTLYEKPLTNAGLFPSFEKLYGNPPRSSKKHISNNNEVDAAICALMGLEFAKDKSNLSVVNPSLKYEGEIYIPSFLNQNPL